jgi:hypothetical protein
LFFNVINVGLYPAIISKAASIADLGISRGEHISEFLERSGGTHSCSKPPFFREVADDRIGVRPDASHANSPYDDSTEQNCALGKGNNCERENRKN